MLTREERSFAFTIMDKIYKKEISEPFHRPVDPIKDNCPNYDLIIKHPMWLDKVKEKLKNSQYDKLEDWVRDVDLIWKNGIVFNEVNNNKILSAMAEDLSIWFRKQLIYANNSQTKDWVKSVLSSTKQIQTHLEKKFYKDSKF